MRERAGLNFIDRVVAFVAPEAGARRLHARTVLHAFASAEAGTDRGRSGGMGRNANSESWVKQRDRIKDMWDARDLAEYDWIGGTLARIVLYVCGELKCKSNTGDPEVDALLDDSFHDWCGDEEDDDGANPCDITGRHRLLKMIQQALLAMFVDGDHGFILADQDAAGNDLGGIKLQAIEADRIGSPVDAKQEENYVGGVTKDGNTGRVLQYSIYDRKLSGQYVFAQDVEPVRFIHLWDPQRSDQYRGRTALRPILPHARHIREWVEAEFIAGKVQSQFAGLIGTRNPNSNAGASFWDKKDAQGNAYRDAKWGQLLQIAEGESFNMLRPSDRPSGAFMAFVQTIIRLIAISLDLPFGFVWDLSGLGGVTARIEVRQAERRIRGLQRLLVDRVLRRVRRAVLDRAVALGELPAHPGMRKCEWHFGPWIVTDAGHEATNDIQLLQQGVISLNAVGAKYDSDPIETGRANATVINALRNDVQTTGVPLEMLAPGLWPNASALLASAASPEPPPPKPGSIEAVGDQGAAAIIDLLSQVTQGKMDPEAAKQALITVYHVPAAKAESIVPRAATRLTAEGAEGAGGGGQRRD